MTLLEHVSQNIIDLHIGNSWTGVNISTTIADISREEALFCTKGSANTIASLVQHLTYWNRIMVIRLGGIAVKISEENGFDHGPIATDVEWENMKKDSLKSAYELADAVKVINEDELMMEILPNHSSIFKSVMGICEHAHYHLGQMVILKSLIRA